MSAKSAYDRILQKLFLTWVICYGFIVLLAVSSWFLPYRWLPLLGFTLMMGIVAFGNYNIYNTGENCSLATHYSTYVLFVSSVIMLVLNILNTRFFDVTFDNVPYVPSIIVFTVASVLIGFAYFRKDKTKYCKSCKQRGGYSTVYSLECMILHSEAKAQLKLGLGISILLTVLFWIYYFTFFISVNINTPDTFVFYFIPVVVFALSVVYVYFEYSNIKFQSVMSNNPIGNDLHTEVRFLVFRHDRILLAPRTTVDEQLTLLDTPATTTERFSEHFSVEDAKELFEKLSYCKDFTIKFLFKTSTLKQTAFHYAIILDSPTTEVSGLEGEWFNLYEIDSLLKEGLVTRPFAYEIHRIFTMTMAWKTYNREGQRLYPIKNYRPTFRLSDFKDWDIDYSDMHWLRIAENNQDKPFFKIKKLWRKYISGVDNIWKKDRL